MALFRKPKGRTALVPNQWSGSVQQYYHFLLGYLAPVILWLDRTGAQSITVRDCGPMNRWFDVLPDSVDVEVMQVGHFLHVFAGDLQPCVVLRGMDYPDEFSRRDLSRFRERLMELVSVPEVEPSAVTILDRRPADPFYFTRESEIDLAGAERRSVPNLGNWAEGIRDRVSLDFFDATDLSVREQVERSVGTRVLVGQHGAGLANMVFMRPGGTVIEIHPPLPEEAVHTFRRLSAACGHEYVTVPQADVHAPVDEAALTRRRSAGRRLVKATARPQS